MKKGLHPKTRTVTVKTSAGETVELQLVVSKSDTIQLSLDMHNHPAWTGKRGDRSAEDQIKRFYAKFGEVKL